MWYSLKPDSERLGKYFAVEYDAGELRYLEPAGRSEYPNSAMERIESAIHERCRRRKWK